MCDGNGDVKQMNSAKVHQIGQNNSFLSEQHFLFLFLFWFLPFLLSLTKAALTADVDADIVLLSLLIDLGCENPKSAGVSRSGRLELELSL